MTVPHNPDETQAHPAPGALDVPPGAQACGPARPLPVPAVPLDQPCPCCGDRLQLYHTHHERRPMHFLGCLSYPRCTYTRPYDAPLHDLLTRLETRLTFLEAQYCWLLGEVEALAAQRQEVQS